MKISFLLLLLTITCNIYSQNKPSYPEPKEGYERIDLLLPKIENQENYRVEVHFGLKADVIECATVGLSFKQSNIIEQYGIPGAERYPYYTIKDNLVEIFEGFDEECTSKRKVEKKLISSQKISYNYQSSYPVPFYVPKGWTLEYRLWKTSDTYITVDK